MLFWVIVKVGLKALMGNKLRSFLSMLGIIIGVGAVIAMLGIGAGAKKTIMARISSMGSNLLIIRPGQNSSGGVMSGTSQNLTVADATALANECAGVAAVSPMVQSTLQAKYMSRNTRTQITGVSPTYMPIRDFQVEHGRSFSDVDCDNRSRVALVGAVAATNIFDTEDPLNKIIKIKGVNFKVIGVLQAKGDGWGSPDDQIIVPYTTAMDQLLGLTYVREIDVQSADGQNQSDVQDALTALLRKRHRTQEGAPEDFTVRNLADTVRALQESSQQFTVLLGGTASISLLVGGIGIMNIMLVSVTERTREIGIRKAIGARRNSILWQFLVESVIVSGLGGLLGVALGMGAAMAIPKIFANFVTIVEPQSIILAVTCSAAVGIFFGLYPAWRAAGLDPVEALRYE